MSGGAGNGAPVGHGAVKDPASESVAPLPAQSVMALPAVAPTTEQDDAQAAVAVLVGRAAGLHRASGASGASLLECFAGVADPRSERGVRHSLPTILGLCTAAVLCGCVTGARPPGHPPGHPPGSRPAPLRDHPGGRAHPHALDLTDYLECLQRCREASQR